MFCWRVYEPGDLAELDDFIEFFLDFLAAHTKDGTIQKDVFPTGERFWKDGERNGGDIAKVRSMRIRNVRGEVTNNIDVRESFCIETEIEVLKPGYGLLLKYDLQTSNNFGAFSSTDTKNPKWNNKAWDVGPHVLRMWVPGNFMQVDTYPINAILWAWEPNRRIEWNQGDAVCVHIIDHLEGPTATAGLTTGTWTGPIRPIMNWEMERISTSLKLGGAIS